MYFKWVKFKEFLQDCQHFVYDEMRRWFFPVSSSVFHIYFVTEIWDFPSEKRKIRSRIIFQLHGQLVWIRAGSSNAILGKWIKWPTARNEAMHLSPEAVSPAATTREETQGPAWENREWEEKKRKEVRYSSLKTNGGPVAIAERYALVLAASPSKSSRSMSQPDIRSL